MVVGGAEKALVNLLDHLDYSRYDVSLWIKNHSEGMLYQVNPHVKIYYWGESLSGKYRGFALSLLKQGKLFSLLYSFFYWVLLKLSRKNTLAATRYRLKSRLVQATETYDTAILFQALPGAYLPIFLALLQSKKRIGWLHGVPSRGFPEAVVQKSLSLYKQFGHLVCVSEGVKEIYTAHYPEIADKFTVIYNLQNIAVILDAAQQSPEYPFDQTTLVTVGRLSREKGQDMIPMIAKRLLEAGYRFVWYVVGDGPTRASLEEEIRQNGLDKVVILTGTKSNPYPFIKNCSLYVQPSYREGFCVTTFEAKILKKPQVVTDVPGMREQFKDNMAYFAQPTVDSLTSAIAKALDDGGASLIFETIDESFNRRELEKIYHLLET